MKRVAQIVGFNVLATLAILFVLETASRLIRPASLLSDRAARAATAPFRGLIHCYNSVVGVSGETAAAFAASEG